jgi:hypothetical protein
MAYDIPSGETTSTYCTPSLNIVLHSLDVIICVGVVGGVVVVFCLHSLGGDEHAVQHGMVWGCQKARFDPLYRARNIVGSKSSSSRGC